MIKVERPTGDLWRVFSHLPGTAKSDLDWCWILTKSQQAQPRGQSRKTS
jgi:hypothetical protein